MNSPVNSSMNYTKKMNRKKKSVILQCPNVACNYRWIYSGKFFLYATCPSCRRNVKILENKSSLQPEQVERPVQAAMTTSAISTIKGENYRHG
jgi:hypothetical protein